MNQTLCAHLLCLPILSMAVNAQSGSADYLTNEQLHAEVQSIASSNASAKLSKIGESAAGNPIHLITLSNSEESQVRPGLLLVAGLDGRYLAGTEQLLRVTKSLVSDHTELLEQMDVYVIPRANPDGAELNLQSMTAGHIGNTQRIDQDRDRMMDEDLPDDLNGDGLITMMRRLEPTLDDAPTHLADPDDPRLNIKPDPDEDQQAVFTIYPEGLDNDGDGQYNEDGIEGVDLDQNFMHRWPEHEPHSGRYPLSEPESEALARFVLDHHNIVMALVLGRHDNLVNTPDSKAKDITGRAPKEIDAEDAEMYQLASKMYKDATSVESASKSDSAGSFHSWLYAQRGIASFAANPWSRPVLDEQGNNGEKADPKPEEDAVADSGLTPSGVGDISQETLDELAELYEQQTGESVDESMISMITPEMIEGFAAQAGVEIKRIKPDPESEPAVDSKEKPKKKKKSEDAKWLDYFDHEEIDGFVDWTPYDHPTLGRVEIGGFVPLARINPPATELEELSSGLIDFVAELVSARPKLVVSGPEVKELADGVYEIRLSLINEGKFPTTTAFSQSKRSVRPSVVSLSTDLDRIVSGQRVSRVWGVDGSGGRSDHMWIIRTDDLSSERIEVNDPRFGNQIINLGN